MKNVKVSDTYSFALIGHSGDVKTSLGEAVLHMAGATTSLGSVREGTSHLNNQPEEKERQTTAFFLLSKANGPAPCTHTLTRPPRIAKFFINITI